VQTQACHRFRFVAALSVDDEPSELDALALARHLEHCSACRAFAATVESFTREMREAEPEAVDLPRSAMRRPRRLYRPIPRSIAGSVVASVAVLGGVAFAVASFGHLQPRSEVPQALRVLVIDASGADASRETQRFLRGLRDASLARTVGAPARGTPEGPGMQAG